MDQMVERSDSHAHQDVNPKDFGTATQVVDETSSQVFPSSQTRDRSPRRASWHGIAIYTALCLSVVPVALLLGFSPKLSTALAYNGCTTNGDFALPYSASVWSPKFFFTITVPFSGTGAASCGYSSDQSAASARDGYGYTAVKAIDLAWDLLVGRGGQLVFAWMAYHVFGAVLTKLMQEGEVGYDLFASIAFQSGSVPALLTTLRHVLGWAPVPRTKRALGFYLGMAMVMLYIAMMPTLLSAMTGYTSLYFFYLINKGTYLADAGAVDCRGTFAPAYGRVVMPTGNNTEDFVLPYDHFPDSDATAPWIDYYKRYQDIYAQCPDPSNVTACPAANVSSRIDRMTFVTNYVGCDRHVCDDNGPVTFPPPFPNFQTWLIGDGRAYTHWLCGADTVFVPVPGRDPEGRMDGSVLGTNETIDVFTSICRAGSRYAWGFSFLLSFLTAVLNIFALAILCAMWMGVRGVRFEQGTLRDAVIMVSQAKRDHGEMVGEWSARALRREVEKGKVGMTTNEGLRRRDREGVKDGARRRYADSDDHD
ncbi:hypothetical protein LTR78_010176 [Recurvomyces mirabilis]|uniref:Uncharacterized protein n=1 Tax=Recurvomyces mirabilis TaxID=574656 RepID=A0AAE0WI49_9PEZI|nr:hypothetical protein LTR78_010176 [Recurvomyces mirabilis]KAK5149705.1 hypothetical protein LTS14_010703 [Recurvomyces mirabilis]